MKLTHTLPMAGAALALLAFAGGAQAQTTTPDSSPFARVRGRRRPGPSLGGSIYVASQRNGIGFQNNPGDGGDDAAFIDGTSSARLQSFFNPFQSRANIASGQNFQIGVHGDANNLTNRRPGDCLCFHLSLQRKRRQRHCADWKRPRQRHPDSDRIHSQHGAGSDLLSGDVSLPSNLLTGSESIIGFTPISAARRRPGQLCLRGRLQPVCLHNRQPRRPVRDKYETVNQIGSPAPTASNIYTITDGSRTRLGFASMAFPERLPCRKQARWSLSASCWHSAA